MSAADLFKGQRFGRLTVLAEEAASDKHRNWLCKCDCGTRIIVRGTKLRTGTQVSCGCSRGDPLVRQAARLVTPAKRRSEIARLGAASRNG
jgi:hypothetical protein